jgi:hypothetical protein
LTFGGARVPRLATDRLVDRPPTWTGQEQPHG